MSTLTADPAVNTAIDYCRRARRIRASFNQDPFLRHQALKDLARQRNLQLLVNPQVDSGMCRSAGLNVSQVKSPALRGTSEPASVGNRNGDLIEIDFTDQVAAKLQPFGFTFSDRIKLLDIAERQGISRFRANVILAMHEHQAGRVWLAAATKPFAPSLMVILAIEIAVVLTLVWVCTL